MTNARTNSGTPASHASVLTLVGLLASSVVAAPAVAWAQLAPPPMSGTGTTPPTPTSSPAPEDRARDAKVACASGDVARGVRLLAELYATTNHPSWVFNQGRCYQQNGKREEAIERFREYLRRGDPTALQQRQEAESFIKELESELRARQTVAPAPVVTAPPVVTTPPATFTPPAPPSTPAETTLTETAPPTDDNTRRNLLIGSAALAGTGVAALVTGIVYGSKLGTVEKNVDRDRGVGGLPYDEWESLKSQGTTYRTWQWIGYGTAAVALASSGALLYFASSPAEVAATPARKIAFVPALTPTTAGGTLHLRF